MKTVSRFIEEPVDLSNPENRSPLIGKIFHVAPGTTGAHIIVSGLQLREKVASRDYFLYCLSGELSRTTMQACSDDYDTVLQIAQPDIFAEALTRCLRKLGYIRGRFIIAPCEYIRRDLEENDPKADVHPALVKDPRYKNQKEVRILWTPVEEEVIPFTMQCDAAARCCTLVRI